MMIPNQEQRPMTQAQQESNLMWQMLHYWEAYGWAFVTERDARQEVQ